MSQDPLFLRAARREPVERTPVWFMRQAGRYLPEYREIRAHHSILEICEQPDLITEITLQPVRRFGVDAAILFADILLPLRPMGLDLEFAAGEGPLIRNPVRSAAEAARLRTVEPRESLRSVLDAVRMIRDQLAGGVPLIGFAGAPFTVASYAIEGGTSRHFLRTKELMYGAPGTWDDLMERITRVTIDYLRAQVEAGVQAVQLFDSWAGTLDPDDYRRFVQPWSSRVFRAIRGVPSIHFGVGTASLLEELAQAGGDVIGLDWRIPLDEGWARVGHQRAVQGNLDPAALFAPLPELERKVGQILERAGGRPGHIFNLGHGILPGTPIEHVARVVELVRSHRLQAATAAAAS